MGLTTPDTVIDACIAHRGVSPTVLSLVASTRAWIAISMPMTTVRKITELARFTRPVHPGR